MSGIEWVTNGGQEQVLSNDRRRPAVVQTCTQPCLATNVPKPLVCPGAAGRMITKTDKRTDGRTDGRKDVQTYGLTD